MRDIATVTLSGNLTREVELRDLPSGKEVARLRATTTTTTRRRCGDEWAEKTNHFTVEVYGARARACAEYLAQVRASWSTPSSTGASGPTNKTSGARRSPSGRARCCSRARTYTNDDNQAQRARRLQPSDRRACRGDRASGPNRSTPPTCRSEWNASKLSPAQSSRGWAGGTTASARRAIAIFFALMVDPARAGGAARDWRGPRRLSSARPDLSLSSRVYETGLAVVTHVVR